MQRQDAKARPYDVLTDLLPDAALAGYPIEPLLSAYLEALQEPRTDGSVQLGLLTNVLEQWERLVVSDLHHLPTVETDVVADARRRMTETQHALAKVRAAVSQIAG